MVLILVTAVAPASAHAPVYSYTDSNGLTHYTDVPGDSRFKEPAIDKASESLLALAAQYDSIIESAAAKAAIQANLVRAVIVVGSGFNAAAVSKQGKAGLMQLTPEKAKRYGVTNIYDPGENINAGTRYLSDLMRRFDNNLPVALAAYNAGEEAVERYGGRIPPFSETLAYVPAVLKVYNQLLPPTTVAFRKDRLQAESIPLIRKYGSFAVAGVINGTITLTFTIDSGAADVSIPADVVSTLTRSGSILPSDFLGTQTYELADGSTHSARLFCIRSLRVGSLELHNVTASVAPPTALLLLGQSFLSRLPAYSIDNRRALLTLNPESNSP